MKPQPHKPLDRLASFIEARIARWSRATHQGETSLERLECLSRQAECEAILNELRRQRKGGGR